MYVFWPQYKLMVNGNIAKHLKKGKNTLAIFSNGAYKKKGEDFVKVAQTDVYIEGLRHSDLQ